jgi:hypothetical protein
MPNQRCISPREIETCAVLGYNDEGEYTHLDGCGYADDSGKCHYHGKIKLSEKAKAKEQDLSTQFSDTPKAVQKPNRWNPPFPTTASAMRKRRQVKLERYIRRR